MFESQKIMVGHDQVMRYVFICSLSFNCVQSHLNFLFFIQPNYSFKVKNYYLHELFPKCDTKTVKRTNTQRNIFSIIFKCTLTNNPEKNSKLRKFFKYVVVQVEIQTWQARFDFGFGKSRKIQKHISHDPIMTPIIFWGL